MTPLFGGNALNITPEMLHKVQLPAISHYPHQHVLVSTRPLNNLQAQNVKMGRPLHFPTTNSEEYRRLNPIMPNNQGQTSPSNEGSSPGQTNLAPFPCAVCPFSFRTEDDLLSHFVEEHREHLDWRSLRRFARPPAGSISYPNAHLPYQLRAAVHTPQEIPTPVRVEQRTIQGPYHQRPRTPAIRQAAASGRLENRHFRGRDYVSELSQCLEEDFSQLFAPLSPMATATMRSDWLTILRRSLMLEAREKYSRELAPYREMAGTAGQPPYDFTDSSLVYTNLIAAYALTEYQERSDQLPTVDQAIFPPHWSRSLER